MQLLAAVEGDGITPLAEVLLTGLPKLRRGMTAVVITPSRERVWVRALSTLRGRGVTAAVITLDAPSYEPRSRRRPRFGETEADPAAQDQRALRFALAEYDLKSYGVKAEDDIGAVLA
jgi:hypothetical protein